MGGLVRTQECPNDLPFVGVVISELNSVQTISQCLTALLNQDYAPTRYKVLVVDAKSTDGTVAKLSALHDHRLEVLYVQGCSEAEGQELGARYLKPDILLFTNSDDIVPANWISSHVSWHKRGLNIVGGAVFHAGDEFMFSWNVVRPTQIQHAASNGSGYGFGNLSVDFEVFDQAGGIAPLRSQQDAEFIFRAMRLGAKCVIDPSIEVLHQHPLGSLQNSLRRSYGYTLNHVMLVRKFSGGSLRPKEGGGVEFKLQHFIGELFGIEGYRAYRAAIHRAPEWIQRVSLYRFLWDRLVGLTLGMVLGTFHSFFKRQSKFSLHNVRRARAPQS